MVPFLGRGHRWGRRSRDVWAPGQLPSAVRDRVAKRLFVVESCHRANVEMVLDVMALVLSEQDSRCVRELVQRTGVRASSVCSLVA